MTAAQNLQLLVELQEAISSLPTFTAGVVAEDEWGTKYDLLRTFVIGERTDDPALVLKIRARPHNSDQEHGVIR